MRLRDKWEDDSKQYRRYNLKQKINSVIFGLAIGDALGVPVEFRDRDTYHISDMVGYGTYNQPAGTWSDDTSLSLALIVRATSHLLDIVLILVFRLIRRLNGIWREFLQRNVEGVVRETMAMEL